MKIFLIIWALSFFWIMSIDSCYNNVQSASNYYIERVYESLIDINKTLLLINDTMQKKP